MQTQSTTWDPERYLRFAQQRARPFADLLARIPAERPVRVVDLGCGPGNATALLAERWPEADVLGLDSSAEMIAAAQAKQIAGRLRFERADLRDWRAAPPVDVLITNATLQWVPGHLDLLPTLLGHVAPGGWFAMGVPGNFGAPSHTLLGDLQRDSRWSDRFTGAHFRPSSHEPADYLRALTAAGGEAEAWETTYYYVLPGVNGVLDFVSSTALRPVLTELGGPGTLFELDRRVPADEPTAAHKATAEFEESSDTDAARDFVNAYADALRVAYPPELFDGRTVQVLPYRRVFAVARIPA
ncbi:MAG TPA: methyltransferase domain-containing protein [Actinocrinis sp.]|uniref:methyltransferase domain-containing protein n=1 Tax=Actinocrinis sp. TaxID=1920516 RepID=UPI002DDDB398|nr:methyltransferase domain-containing protein [Actinocrinis sp.]HEV2343555.1 methyltransferase domain-containing protein [Actinocrinis sp.]